MTRRRWVLVGLVLSLMAPSAATMAASTHDVNGLIVFTSTRDGNSEIYVMRQDGSNQTRLTNNTLGEADPVWSPDGSKIAFIRTVGSNHRHLRDELGRERGDQTYQ